MTGGIGVDAALECVGTGQSDRHRRSPSPAPAPPSASSASPTTRVPFEPTFFRNVGWRGGPAPSRLYIPELMGDVLDGRIDPGRVLDFETDLDGIADAYAAMDERRAIKSLLRIGSV